MRSLLLGGLSLAFSTIVALTPAGAAGTRYAGPDNAVRTACRGDAIKFCSAVIRDSGKRRACMSEHRAELSPGCIAALGGN